MLEVHEISSYYNYSSLIGAFFSILSFNYSIRPLNCKSKSAKYTSSYARSIWTYENRMNFNAYLSIERDDKEKCPDLRNDDGARLACDI